MKQVFLKQMQLVTICHVFLEPAVAVDSTLVTTQSSKQSDTSVTPARSVCIYGAAWKNRQS
eukprot:7146275-Karenia_brevis.AAC.1